MHDARGCARGRRAGTMLLVLGVCAGAFALGGCGGGGLRSSGADPLEVVLDRRAQAEDRSNALREARELAGSDSVALASVNNAALTVAWNASEDRGLRQEALLGLLDSPDEATAAKGRDEAIVLMAREPDRGMGRWLAATAAARGWTQATPALLRSLARAEVAADAQETETGAIVALNQNRPLAEVAWEQFMLPPRAPQGAPGDWQERVRVDAWQVLSRLDPQGALRRERLLGAASSDERTTALLETLRAGERDLGVLPLTGPELAWLETLRTPESKGRRAWWEETARVVAGLPDSAKPLRLRHLEAVRATARLAPQRLTASRGELLEELRGRLRERSAVQRDWGGRRPPYVENLEAHEATLTWGDLVLVLMVDDALATPGLTRMLLDQQRLDRADRTTEYGGVLAVDGLAGNAWWPVLFPPRAAQRLGDERFVASDDMLRDGDRALVQYHFHAQRERNGAFAGPSEGDIAYAELHARGCVVFTSVGRGRLNADFYAPGVVIDLGVLTFAP